MKPLSWSELYLFNNDRPLWHRRYILGEKTVPNMRMVRGKDIHEAVEGKSLKAFDQKHYTRSEIIANQECHDYALQWIIRETDEQERCVEVEIAGVPTISYWDAYQHGLLDADGREIRAPTIKELKTGEYIWPLRRIEEHGQIPFYNLQHIELYDTTATCTFITVSWKNPKKNTAFNVSSTDEQLARMKERIVTAWDEMGGLRSKRKSSRETLGTDPQIL
jgi:hypothetical protein